MTKEEEEEEDAKILMEGEKQRFVPRVIFTNFWAHFLTAAAVVTLMIKTITRAR